MSPHRWPEMLPGGAAILFMVIEEGATTRQLVNARIALLNLETGEQRVLLDEEDYNARYVLTGHIVYARSGMLLAAPFDVDDLVITAPPILILEGVRFRPAGAVDFDISDSGLLAYINGGSNFEAPRTFIWVDREGNEAPVEIELRRYREFGLSPDGTRTAVRVAAEDNDDVWILDLDRNTSSRLTLEPATEAFPIWTPDGSRVAFGRPDFPMSWEGRGRNRGRRSPYRRTTPRTRGITPDVFSRWRRAGLSAGRQSRRADARWRTFGESHT